MSVALEGRTAAAISGADGLKAWVSVVQSSDFALKYAAALGSGVVALGHAGPTGPV